MAEQNRPAPQILDDLKVIDLSSMIAGPTCGRLFAELGADVIHVEPPWGDDGRNSTTPFLGCEAAQVERNELFTAWVTPQTRDDLIASLRAEGVVA